VSDPDHLTQALDRAGYHRTAPRRAVAELVAAHQGRFSAEDLVREAQRGRRGVGRATVFRSLEIFESLGLVERVHLPSGEHAYVACEPARHHHHVVCERCGRNQEVGDVGIDPIARAIEQRTGYLVDSHRIEFFGLCPACRDAASGQA
jgi:Fur family transcriptional regulator, ferric uptake regulator